MYRLALCNVVNKKQELQATNLCNQLKKVILKKCLKLLGYYLNYKSTLKKFLKP